MTHRVLHIINTAEVGGGGEHLLQLTGGLRTRNVVSHIIVGRMGAYADRLHAAGVPVTVIGPMGVLAPFRLARLLREQRPDLIHLHGSRAGAVGTMAVRWTGQRPVIYTAHAFAFHRKASSAFRWTMARMEARTCRSADHVVCLTRADADAAVSLGASPSRVTVIPNGIDVARFSIDADARIALGLNPAAPVVGLIGRLVPQKDPLTFVRMARLVADALPPARFLIVGDGPLRDAVEEAVRQHDLRAQVIQTGFRDDVPALLASMDVVVLSSLWEGLPIIVLEAMAAAKPVVATALPGLNEVVVDGDTGLLVPPRDPDRLAAAVLQVLRDPQRARVMGQRGRARVSAEFSVARMVEATTAVYSAAIAAEYAARAR